MNWTLKRILKYIAWGCFACTILVYAFYQSRGVRAGTTIILDGPQDGATVTTALVRVSGSAKESKELTLNGRDIFIDLDGHFDEQLLLSPGYNIIELTAKDTGGNETRRTIELAYLPSTDLHATPQASTTDPFATDSPVTH